MSRHIQTLKIKAPASPWAAPFSKVTPNNAPGGSDHEGLATTDALELGAKVLKAEHLRANSPTPA